MLNLAEPDAPLLDVQGLRAGYGQSEVLHGIDFTVAPGEIVVFVGRNGMGKTTLMKSLIGMLPVSAGAASTLDADAELAPLPEDLCSAWQSGLAFVPQGRMIFSGDDGAGEHRNRPLRSLTRSRRAAFDLYDAVSRCWQRDAVRGAAATSRADNNSNSPSRAPSPPNRNGSCCSMSRPRASSRRSSWSWARTLKRIRDERGLSIIASEQLLSFALDIADRVLVHGRRGDRAPGARAPTSTRTGLRASSRSDVVTHHHRRQTEAANAGNVDQGRPVADPPYENDMIHNRWHPDIPMVATVKPGQDFIIECYDWTGGFIKNDDSAADVRDIDLSIVHFLSGPVGVEGAEPGDLLVVDFLDIGAFPHNAWGFNGFFSKKNGGGFLTDHFPQAQKSIWDLRRHVHHLAARAGGEVRRVDPSRG